LGCTAWSAQEKLLIGGDQNMSKSKNRSVKIWGIVTALLLVFCITLTVVATSIRDFYELLNIVMPGGGPRAIYADGVKAIYTSDYTNKADVYEAARDINQKLCEEGMVLLKNRNNALPLNTTAGAKVSIFGKNSVSLAYGGSGSGGANTSNVIDLYKAMTEAGFTYNPALKAFYEDTGKSGPVRKGNSKDLDSGDTVVLSTAETPQSMYTADVKASYAGYNDAAIIVISRIGGEGFDLPRKMTGATGYRNEDDHYLQLDKNEEDLISAVCTAGFGKVILVVNSGQPMELGFLESASGYVALKNYRINPDKIDAAIWMSFPGETGTHALAGILNGSVNPSGKLADTYTVDFKQDPTWQNFGDNRITGQKGIPGGDQYVFNVSNDMQPSVPYYFVDYEEGVYVGYKYYETRGAEDPKWYSKNVVYPFGHGLSYTTFSWELSDAAALKDAAISQGKTYTIQVKVTNTGSVAGKDVVELYGHAPYTKGGIEKPEITLLDFAKTSLLQPGQSETVTMTFDPYYLASYDYKDANRNGNKGFELESGKYELYVMHNAHQKELSIPFTVASNILYNKDTVTGKYDVVNRYTDSKDPKFNSDTSLETVLSRSNWEGTFPATPTQAERNGDAKLLDWLSDKTPNNPNDYSSVEMPYSEESNGLTLRDLLNSNDGTSTAKYDDERWESLMDQASVSDLNRIFNYAAYHIEEVDSIGLPRITCSDGPVGWSNFMDKTRFYDTNSYCSQTLIATTWNKDLVEKFGEMVGNEGIVGNERGDKTPYTGWYAPAVNIHRSPFGGRNFEYYSEDGVLSGKIAAAQIQGCNAKGLVTFVKHFAANEQETHRSISGDSSWLTEQALREIYLRPFEIAVKEGKAKGMMSSFNRIGTRWTGGDYRLLTEILRNEWGFKGTVICDFNTIPAYMNSRQMAYAGGSLNLATQPESWCDESSAADVYVLRQNIKDTLYAFVNSNAMNGEIIGYGQPFWVIGLIAFDIIVVIVLAVWGVAVFRKLRKEKYVLE
jgi:beta-glucosidase